MRAHACTILQTNARFEWFDPIQTTNALPLDGWAFWTNGEGGKGVRGNRETGTQFTHKRMEGVEGIDRTSRDEVLEGSHKGKLIVSTGRPRDVKEGRERVRHEQ